MDAAAVVAEGLAEHHDHDLQVRRCGALHCATCDTTLLGSQTLEGEHEGHPVVLLHDVAGGHHTATAVRCTRCEIDLGEDVASQWLLDLYEAHDAPDDHTDPRSTPMSTADLTTLLHEDAIVSYFADNTLVEIGYAGDHGEPPTCDAVPVMRFWILQSDGTDMTVVDDGTMPLCLPVDEVLADPHLAVRAAKEIHRHAQPLLGAGQPVSACTSQLSYLAAQDLYAPA